MDLSANDKTLSFHATFTLCDEGTAFMERAVRVGFSIPEDASPLKVMKETAAHELSLDATDTVTFVATPVAQRSASAGSAEAAAPVEADGVQLATDSDVVDFAHRYGGEIAIEITRTRRSPSVTQALSVTRALGLVPHHSGESPRGSEGGEEERLEAAFRYTLDQANLLEALRQEVRHAFDLDDAAPLLLTATVDGDAVPLVSDGALLRVLDHLRETDATEAPLAVTFDDTTQSSRTAKVTVGATRRGDMGLTQHDFVFAVAADQPQVLEALKQECRGEMELAADADVALFAYVHGEGEQPLSSDSAVAEALLAHAAAAPDAVFAVTVEERQRAVKATVALKVQVDGEWGELPFTFAADQSTLLDALRQEVAGELELPADIRVTAVIEDERVPLVSDKQTLDVLLAHTADGLVIEAGVEEASSQALRSACVKVTFGEDTVEFVFSYRPELPNLLTQLLAECCGEHEEHDASVENLALFPVVDGAVEAVPLGDSAAQHALDHAAEADTVLELVLQPAPRTITQRVPLFTMYEGERVEHTYVRTMGGDVEPAFLTLRQHISDVLDLDPGEEARLVMLVPTEEGTDFELAGDAAVHELCCRAVEGGEAVEIKYELAAVAAAHPTRRRSEKVERVLVKALYTATQEAVEFEFTFTMSQDNVLQALRQELRGELELFNDEPLALSHSVAGTTEAILIASDQALRNLCDSDEARTADGDIVLDLQVAEIVSPITRTVRVEVEVPSSAMDPAAFSFPFTLEAPGLRDAFRDACVEALDLETEPTALAVVCVVDGDSVPLVSDRQATEVLFDFATRNAVLVAQLVAAEARPATHGIPLKCVLVSVEPPREAEAVLRYVQSEPRPLESLWQEARHALDIDSAAALETTVAADGDTAEPVVAKTDAALRPVLDAAAQSGATLRVAVAIKDHNTPAADEVLGGGSEEPKGGAPAALTVAAELDGRSCEFSHRFDLAAAGAVDKLRARLVQELQQPPGAYLRLTAWTTSKQEAFELSDDDELVGLVQNGYADTVHVEVTVTDAPPTTSSRAAELRALCNEWADVTEDAAGVVECDLEPVITTFTPGDIPEGVGCDPLQTHYKAFAQREGATVPVVDLFLTLQQWTQHYSDKDLFAFCYHCRGTIDFLVSVSPAADMRRAVARAFRAHAVAARVEREFLRRSLADSGCIADAADLDDALADYGEHLTEAEFAEVLRHFFDDAPQHIRKIFALAQARRPGSSGTRQRGATHVDAMRKDRLRSDIRHALDGIVPVALEDFADAASSRPAPWCLEIASCVALLLRVPGVAPADRDAAWRWLLEQCRDGELAEALLKQLATADASVAPQAVIADVAARLSPKEAHPSRLLASSPVLAGLAVWCAAVSQLTSLVNHWPWPPLQAPEVQFADPALNSPVKAADSPPRRRQPSNANGSRAVMPTVSRYEFRHSVDGMDLTDVPHARDLRGLLVEAHTPRPPTEPRVAPANQGDASDVEKPAPEETAAAAEEEQPAEDTAAQQPEPEEEEAAAAEESAAEEPAAEEAAAEEEPTAAPEEGAPAGDGEGVAAEN